MTFSAKVNGRRISSNKNCDSSITDNRITFDDGSWYDFRTNKVHVVGDGYISVDGVKHDTFSGDSKVSFTKSTDSALVTRELGVFDATKLDLRLMTADANVAVHEGPGIRLSVTAPADQIELIKYSVKRGVLVIDDQSHGSNLDLFAVNNSLRLTDGDSFIGRALNFLTSGSIFSRSSVRITGSAISGDSEVKISISVPKGTPADVTCQGLGHATVGDIDASLTATISSLGDLIAGSVTDVNAELKSSGELTVAHVSGDVDIHASGLGGARINDGAIGNLTVVVQSSGEVVVKAAAQKARLTTSGLGDIKVGHVHGGVIARAKSSGVIRIKYVEGDVDLRATGLGDIVIKGGDIDMLLAVAKSSGCIDVSATAQMAELTSTGLGDIKVDRVIQPPIKHKRSSGDIKVARVG